MDFKIVVRSYRRSESILNATLLELSKQKDVNLANQLVLVVADKPEYREYTKTLKEYPIHDVIVSGVGGCIATNKAVDAFPEGERIVFMDDDLENFRIYQDVSKEGSNIIPFTELGRLTEYGFSRMTKSPICTVDFFRSWSDPALGKKDQPFMGYSHRTTCGAWWMGYNTKHFKTSQSHEDDNIRTAKILEEWGGVYSLNWLEAINKWGITPGGMQASTERGVDRERLTYEACLKALQLPHVARFYLPVPDLCDGMYTLRLKNPDLQYDSWSGYYQDEPDRGTFIPPSQSLKG